MTDHIVEEQLPSWNAGPPKQAIVDFVTRVCTPDSPDFVEPAERIAVFDNDGTLWSEQPFYVQAVFVFERIRALAEENPEWETTQPFKAALEGDLKSIVAGGEPVLLELVMATHAGMTTSEFSAIVKDWLGSARHPATDRLYTEMIYQPMLELLTCLRSNGFKTFITSGGGIEFIRIFAEEVYGIPPEQVIGSSIRTQYEYRDGHPALVRLAELNFFDDREGKPVAINQHIGRRPIAAFGNSDGDLPMMQWTYAGDGARFCLYIHHTDAEREWAYDRDSFVGKFDKGIEQARTDGWTMVDMQNDWNTVFPASEE